MDVYKEVWSIFPQGPDVAIEAVGFHYVEVSIHLLAKPAMAVKSAQ